MNRWRVFFMFSFLIHGTFIMKNIFHTKGVLGIKLSLRKFGLFSLDIKKKAQAISSILMQI